MKSEILSFLSDPRLLAGVVGNPTKVGLLGHFLCNFTHVLHKIEQPGTKKTNMENLDKTWRNLRSMGKRRPLGASDIKFADVQSARITFLRTILKDWIAYILRIYTMPE